MTVYFGGFLSLVILRFSLINDRSLSKFAYWIVLTSLFLITAFRWEVGCDWYGYWNQFSIVASSPDFNFLNAKRDQGWWYLLSLIDWLGFDYPVIYVPAAFAFFWGAHRMAYRQPDPLAFLILLVPLLIVGIAMSGVRQGIATGFAMLAFLSFIDGQRLKFVMWICIGTLFHSSIFIFITLLPLIGSSITLYRIASAALFSVPIFIIISNSEVSEEAINRYVSSGRDAFGAVFRVGFIAGSGILFFVFFKKKWKEFFPEDYVLVTVSSSLMIFLFFVLSISTIIADRFAYYLIPIQAMIFARLPYLRLGKSSQTVNLMTWTSVVILFGVWTAYSWHFQRCYVPYQSWITGYPDVESLWLLK